MVVDEMGKWSGNNNIKKKSCIRFQETIPMPINNLNGITIRNGDMIRLDSNNLAVLFVGGIDGEVASPATGLVHEP